MNELDPSGKWSVFCPVLYLCIICTTNTCCCLNPGRGDKDVWLDVLIRASPSGFPTLCIYGIYCKKYLERLIVQIKRKYKIWSKIELILWSSALDFIERNAFKIYIKRCGRFFSNSLVLSKCWKYCLPHCYSIFFFVCIWIKRWLMWQILF